jgi:hypothetical protein
MASFNFPSTTTHPHTLTPVLLLSLLYFCFTWPPPFPNDNDTPLRPIQTITHEHQHHVAVDTSLSANTGPRFRRLNAAVAGLLDEYSLVSFVPLDISDEDSIGEVLLQIDMAIQYGEDADVMIREFEGQEGGGEGADELD